MRFITLFAILALACAGALRAQPPVQPQTLEQPSTAASGNPAVGGAAETLTIAQALALSEQNSPLLRQANAGVARAQAGIRAAKAYSNPTFEFLGGQQYARPVPNPGVPGLLFHYSASQTVEIPRERSTRIATSKLDLSASRFQSAGIRLSVAAEVKRAFYDVILRKQQLVNARDNLSLVEDLRRRVSLEVSVGEIGRLELTRAEAETARAQTAVRGAEIELANARALLKASIGATTGGVFDADGTLGETVQIASLDDLRRQILANHPAMAEANAVAERSRANVQHQEALRIPAPAFYGEYEHQPDQTFYRAGVSIPLPLWNRNSGPIGQAKADLDAAQAAINQRRLELTASLERAYDQYQISNQQVQGLQAGSLKEAEAAVDAATAAYRFGERGIVEVLDAQRVLQGVRNDLLDAQYARQSALIDLQELGVSYP